MAEGNCEMLAGGKTDINQGTLPLKMGVRVILLWMIKEGLVPKRRFVTPLRPPATAGRSAPTTRCVSSFHPMPFSICQHRSEVLPRFPPRHNR